MDERASANIRVPLRRDDQSFPRPGVERVRSGAEGAEGGFFFDYEDPLQPSKEDVFYLGDIWYEDPVKV